MTLQIKILGTGCPKCKTLEKITREVVSENQMDANISKVDDIQQIMNYGVMATPALVINEKVAIGGRIPSKEEIKKQLESYING